MRDDGLAAGHACVGIGRVPVPFRAIGSRHLAATVRAFEAASLDFFHAKTWRLARLGQVDRDRVLTMELVRNPWQQVSHLVGSWAQSG